MSDKWWHKLISLFFFSKHDYFGFLKLEPDWAGFLCFNSSFCLLYRSVAKSSCTPPIEIWPNHHNNVSFLPQTPFKNDWGDREPEALTQTHPAFTHNAVQHKPQTKEEPLPAPWSWNQEGHRSSPTAVLLSGVLWKRFRVAAVQSPLAGDEIQMAWRLILCKTAPAPGTVDL